MLSTEAVPQLPVRGGSIGSIIAHAVNSGGAVTTSEKKHTVKHGSKCCQRGWRRDHKSSDRRYDSIRCKKRSHSDHKSSESILKCMVVHNVNEVAQWPQVT